MESQSLWLIALSAATPIAGVVGFALQLRQVKKARLENEKLQLEIAALRTKAAAADSRIVRVSTKEVERYTQQSQYQLQTPGTKDELNQLPARKSKAFKNFIFNAAVISSIVLFATYFIYDLYRIIVLIYDRY